jgi:hypothetical protein
MFDVHSLFFQLLAFLLHKKMSFSSELFRLNMTKEFFKIFLKRSEFAADAFSTNAVVKDMGRQRRTERGSRLWALGSGLSLKSKVQSQKTAISFQLRKNTKTHFQNETTLLHDGLRKNQKIILKESKNQLAGLSRDYSIKHCRLQATGDRSRE